MKNLKVAELKVIAKELGIALSYTENGKRHALNKAELIEAIEAAQTEQVETTETTLTSELEQQWETLNESVSMSVNEMADAIEEYEMELLAKRKRTVTTNLIIAKPHKSNAIIVSGENIKLNYPSNTDHPNKRVAAYA